jgi:hypothetical protein
MPSPDGRKAAHWLDKETDLALQTGRAAAKAPRKRVVDPLGEPGHRIREVIGMAAGVAHHARPRRPRHIDHASRAEYLVHEGARNVV